MERSRWTIPESHVYHQNINEVSCESLGSGFFVTPAGVTAKFLEFGVMVEITGDESVRVIDTSRNILIVLGRNPSIVGLKHPVGCCFQQQRGKLAIMTFDPRGDPTLDRFARFTPYAISFKDRCSRVCYQILRGQIFIFPCRNFFNMGFDFTAPILYRDCDRGIETYLDESKIIRTFEEWERNEVCYWKLQNILISQMPDGVVRVCRNNYEDIIRLDPFTGKVSLSTNSIHVTASMGTKCHFFVRRDEHSIHYNGNNFWAKLGDKSLGLDRFNRTLQRRRRH